jgi:hypothetical protein
VTIPLDTWHQWWKHNGSRELRDLVQLWWDPVGTYAVPEALSEYNGYTGKIAQLLRDGATEDDLFGHFSGLMERFGLPVREERDRIAAARILSWYQQSMGRMSELTTTRCGRTGANP